MSTIVHGKQEQNAWFARNGKEFPGLVRPFGSEVVVKMPVEIDGRSKLDCTGSRALYLGPHLQAGHVFRGQYNVVLLNALADPELKVARAVHVMVNVSFPSAAVFPAFEAKQKLQSDAIASSLNRQEGVVFDPVVAQSQGSQEPVNLNIAPSGETLEAQVRRQRAAKLWWPPRAGA